MNYKLKIKASGISDLTNARFFASQMLDWVGIDLNPLSEAALTLPDAEEIIGWLAGTRLVGEFEHRDGDEILYLTEQLGLDAIQVPYGTRLPAHELPVFEHLPLTSEAIPAGLSVDQADYVILELPGIVHPDEISPEMLDFMELLFSEKAVFLAAEFDSDTLPDFIHRFAPYGIDLPAGSEMGSGMSDFAESLELLNLLRS